jgi:hypothetical protein
LDRDPLTFDPRGQLFGYPPVYFPAATDLAAASIIRLAPGSTFQANISPVRREYYPVKIKVANAPGAYVGIQVWPRGNASPGYSLGYNPRGETIEGLLPDGTYEVRATSQALTAMTGSASITVGGGALEGPVVTLVPNTSITVNIRREFQHLEASGAGTFGISGSVGGKMPRNYTQVILQSAEELGFPQSAYLRQPTNPETTHW